MGGTEKDQRRDRMNGPTTSPNASPPNPVGGARPVRIAKASRLLFLSGLLSLAAGAVVLAAREQPATRPTTNPATRPPGKAVNAFCPVETADEVDPRVTIIYEGKVIGFCCTDCLRDFQKDPKKYMREQK